VITPTDELLLATFKAGLEISQANALRAVFELGTGFGVDLAREALQVSADPVDPKSV